MPDDPKPSVAGQAITFQSLLQYVLMALVGLLAYFQNESSKSTAWARAEVVEARKDAANDRHDAATERESLRKAFDQALVEVRANRREVQAVQVDVTKAAVAADTAAKVGERTLKAVQDQ